MPDKNIHHQAHQMVRLMMNDDDDNEDVDDHEGVMLIHD